MHFSLISSARPKIRDAESDAVLLRTARWTALWRNAVISASPRSRRNWPAFREALRQDDRAVERAQRDLMDAWKNGEFDRDGQSSVRLRTSEPAMERVGYREIADAIRRIDQLSAETAYGPTQLYIHRSVCHDWFDRRSYAAPAGWGTWGPKEPTVRPASPQKGRKSEAATRRWYAERVLEFQGKRPPSRDDDDKAGEALGHQRKYIRKARATAPAEWHKRGRRERPAQQ